MYHPRRPDRRSVLNHPGEFNPAVAVPPSHRLGQASILSEGDGCGLGKCAVVDPHERDLDAYASFAADRDSSALAARSWVSISYAEV